MVDATNQDKPSTVDNFVTIESATLSRPEQYKLLCSAVATVS